MAKKKSTSNFNLGDVVQLKSGGPKMTICFIDGDKITTTYFDSYSELQESNFAAETLTVELDQYPVLTFTGPHSTVTSGYASNLNLPKA